VGGGEESELDKKLFPGRSGHYFNRYGRGLGSLTLGIGMLIAFAITESQNSANLRQEFRSNINQITSDANRVEQIQDLTSIRRNGKNWYHVNASDANCQENKFFTPQGNLGNGTSATLAKFLKSTHLTQEQTNALKSFMDKYPYITEVTRDPNMSGACSLATERQCTALKFYSGSYGYLYTPFDLDTADTTYLQKAFRGVSQVSDNWHEFEGESLPSR
jgi:hypothetical protein